MKMKFVLSVSAVIFLLFSCNPDNNVAPSQVNSKIQYKWTLISSTLNFPTNATLNSRYVGASSDYYLFDKEDTLTVQQAGSVNLVLVPLFYKFKYGVVNNSTLVYNPNVAASIQVRILTLNDTLLVLQNDATATFINADNSQTVYSGEKTDSLRR